MVDAFGFYFDHAFSFYDNLKRWMESENATGLFKDLKKECLFEPSACEGVKRARMGKVLIMSERGCYPFSIMVMNGTSSLNS